MEGLAGVVWDTLVDHLKDKDRLILIKEEKYVTKKLNIPKQTSQPHYVREQKRKAPPFLSL